ncbi:MAG: hypothetical protein GY929_19245 [Actinomycetia bacterium]|nr:hypothetical protein [Actinomycetes bacterium]
MNAGADSLRQRLVDIDSELRALPADGFARKYELSTESDAVRAQLAELTADDLDDANREWAERAGRKGAHAERDDLERSARIASPIEGGDGL